MNLTILHHFINTVVYMDGASCGMMLLGGNTMPRESPFVIDLSQQERNVLEGRARTYTAPYRDVVRAKIVLMAAEGLPNNVIAERLDIPRQIASKWRKRFFEHRLAGLQDRPRRGRPPTS